MFEDVLRELRRMERGTKITIQLELDENGNLDRRCPSDDCSTHFKVNFDDWRNIVRDEVVYCPLCKHSAAASEWKTPEQAEQIRRITLGHVQRRIGRALQSDSRRFNARQTQGGLISMSMSYRPGHISVSVPAAARDAMTQEFRCHECDCRYSSIGAAFFCPSCGHDAVLDTFANSVNTVIRTVEAIPTLRDALRSAANENVAEDSVRHICENGLVKLVASFQRYAEACFLKLPNADQFKVRRNLFQNLEESDVIWRNATGRGYTDRLDDGETALLNRYFQQRHLLSHRDGIVDQQYIDRSADSRLAVGQRLRVTAENVVELAAVVQKLAPHIAPTS